MKSYQKLFFIEIFKMHAFLLAALTLNLKNMKTIVFRGLFEDGGIFSSMLCIL